MSKSLLVIGADCTGLCPQRQKYRLSRWVWLGIGCSLGLNLGGATAGLGQAQSSNSSSSQRQVMPTPLVSAGFPPSTQDVDWSHYTTVEACVGVFQRVLLSALPLKRDTTHDSVSVRPSPWRPLPPAAIQVGRQCLSQFRIAELPALALPSALRLAVGVNADSLVPAILARQLAQVPSGPARVAMLRTAIEVLVRNHWEGVQSDGSFTETHIQQAKAPLVQLDALGAIAIRDRVELREGDGLLQEAAIFANDVDAQLALARDVDNVFHQVPLDSLPKDSTELRRWYVAHAAVNALHTAALTYVQSLSHADLAKYVATWQTINKGIGSTRLGMQSPAVSGDYWFNTPRGSSVPVPAPGKINILWFQSHELGDVGYDWTSTPRTLRQLHREFPDVQITVVTHTNGAIRQHAFVDHPEQEAALQGQFWADSVHVPGVVCVLKSGYKTVDGGHVVPLPLPVWEAYHLHVDGGGVFVTDRTGMIVAEGDRPYLQDLMAFVRRLEAKGPPATAVR